MDDSRNISISFSKNGLKEGLRERSCRLWRRAYASRPRAEDDSRMI